MELGPRRWMHHPAGRHHRSQGRLSDRAGGEVPMKVTRPAEARRYEAPNHRGSETLRLMGLDEGGSQAFWVGMTHFEPGGGAGPDASPPEKVYFVLKGELTVIIDGKETVLKANDCCYIAPNERREIVNRTSDVATMLVAITA